jgi:hypothetical protein
MAERKRLPESPVTNSKKIKLVQTTLPFGTSTRPLCKYGAKCYRKHPDHLRDFHHPLTDKKEDDDDEDSSTKKTSTTSSASSSPVKHTTTTSSSNSTISLMELAELNGEQLLSHVYQMEFPSDLYEFWKFCSNMNNKNPRGKKEKHNLDNHILFLI